MRMALFPETASILFYDLSRNPLRNHKECIDIDHAVDGNRLTQTIRTSASCEAGPFKIRGRGCTLSHLFYRDTAGRSVIKSFFKKIVHISYS